MALLFSHIFDIIGDKDGYIFISSTLVSVFWLYFN